MEEGEATTMETMSEEETKRGELDEFFKTLTAGLGGDEAKDIVAKLTIVAAALEKEIPAFLSELHAKGVPSAVLGAFGKLLSLDEVAGCVKALRCYGEVIKVPGGSDLTRDVETTVGPYLQLSTTILEKASGSSPGKGSPKKDGTKELTQNYPPITEALVRIYNIYTLGSSKLVVLRPEAAQQLQDCLVGAKDKNSAIVKSSLLDFLANAPVSFPTKESLQTTLESTLDVVLGPFKAHLASKEGGEDEAAAKDAPADFEVVEDHHKALAAAAALVKNNASLLSESVMVTWVKAMIELATTVHGEYLEAKKEKPELTMPAILGANLLVSLFQAASLAGAKAVAVACLESTLPKLLGEKLRLLVKGPPKVEESEEDPPESPKKGQADPEPAQEPQDEVLEKEAVAILAVTRVLFELCCADPEGLAVYKAISEGMEEAEAVSTSEEEGEAQPSAEGDAGAGEDGGQAETAGEGEGSDAAADGEKEEDKTEEAEEEEEEKEVGDDLVAAMFAISSGNLDFEVTRVPQEAGTDEEAEAPTEDDADAEASGEGDAEDQAEANESAESAEGSEEAPAGEAAAPEEEAPEAPPKERPANFLLQDSAAHVLYSMATSPLSNHLSTICVPSTLVGILESGKALPDAVLEKLLVVLLYAGTDAEKTRVALEKSSLCLGQGEGGALNVAKTLCAISSFKMDLADLLPIKCPPEPSPPPTPPPPPLATNKFLWDALGRPDMVDGGNLPTLRTQVAE